MGEKRQVGNWFKNKCSHIEIYDYDHHRRPSDSTLPALHYLHSLHSSHYSLPTAHSLLHSTGAEHGRLGQQILLVNSTVGWLIQVFSVCD